MDARTKDNDDEKERAEADRNGEPVASRDYRFLRICLSCTTNWFTVSLAPHDDVVGSDARVSGNDELTREPCNDCRRPIFSFLSERHFYVNIFQFLGALTEILFDKQNVANFTIIYTV